MTNTLFYPVSIQNLFDDVRNAVSEDIRDGNVDDLIREDPDSAIKQLRTEYAMKPVKIKWKKKSLGCQLKDTMLTIPLRFTFTGDPRLLQYIPNQYMEIKVAGVVTDRDITVEFAGNLDVYDFKREYERWLECMKFNLENINSDVEKFNRELSDTIKSVVGFRAECIRKADAVMVDLGIPQKS